MVHLQIVNQNIILLRIIQVHFIHTNIFLLILMKSMNDSSSSWDSNFLTLFGGVEYDISAIVYNDRSQPTTSSNLEFYLTSSNLDFKSSTDFNVRSYQF